MSNVVATESFSITMERKCLCPLIVTHGVDQAQRLHNLLLVQGEHRRAQAMHYNPPPYTVGWFSPRGLPPRVRYLPGEGYRGCVGYNLKPRD